MRLNKYIGETGFCSRREADRLIAERRVTVNGEPAGIGTQVQEGDEVRIDGQGLKARAAAPKGKRRHAYIALNKPVGITCTTEASVKGNIVDFVGHQQRIFPVGRLDKDSEGLILLTSNGDIVNVKLGALKVGQWRNLTDAELHGLLPGREDW
jgi:23S rRNA pseudouridine2604 synthase